MSDLADRVPVPVVTVDRDGVVVETNEPAVDQFGADLQSGVAFDEFVAAASAEAFSDLLSIQNETTTRLQVHVSAAVLEEHVVVGDTVEEDVVDYDVTAGTVEDGIELVFDTTPRHRRYRSLVQSISDPIYMLDDDGVVRMVNDAFAAEYGWAKEEVVGKHVREFMPDGAVERARGRIRELLSNGETTTTFEFQGADAEARDRWTEVRISVLRDDDGEFTGTAGVFRDITERKERERELAAFETIAETAPVEMFTVDENGALTWANRRFYERFGVEKDELLDRPFLEMVEDGLVEMEMVERYVEYLKTLLSSSNDVDRIEHEEVLHPPDEDDPVIVDAYTSLLPLDEDGEFTGTVNAFRNITQRKAYREALERQNERLEAFASLVSHDLRNPLNVATGYLDVARDRHPDDDALDEVAYSLDRMSELIEDLLALARQGEAVGETHAVSLEAVAEQAWATVETGEADLEVRTSERVECDETRLRQVFENLFRNSAEHGVSDPTRDAGDGDGSTDELTVTVGATDDGFYVADGGVGLPTDLDLFDLGATTNEDGTGLGLAIVQEIVDAHGWTIAAGASEAGGARFDITGVEIFEDDGQIDAAHTAEADDDRTAQANGDSDVDDESERE